MIVVQRLPAHPRRGLLCCRGSGTEPNCTVWKMHTGKVGKDIKGHAGPCHLRVHPGRKSKCVGPCKCVTLYCGCHPVLSPQRPGRSLSLPLHGSPERVTDPLLARNPLWRDAWRAQARGTDGSAMGLPSWASSFGSLWPPTPLLSVPAPGPAGEGGGWVQPSFLLLL